MITVEVVHPGILTTIQDAGRPGYAYFAVPRSGPVQSEHARHAQSLVGNRNGAPLVEFGLMGARLRFEAPAEIALCGADLRWSLDGREIAREQRIVTRAGSVLEGGYTRQGRFGYLAVAGELMRTAQLGSVSMHSRIHGRLQKGDRLVFARQQPQPDSPALPPTAALGDRPSFCLELLPGPEWDLLTGVSQHALTHARWSISPQSDRVGSRLTGPRLELRSTALLESVPVWVGCVQVDPSGTVIVVGVDGAVVGGYPRVATLVGTRD